MSKLLDLAIDSDTIPPTRQHNPEYYCFSLELSSVVNLFGEDKASILYLMHRFPGIPVSNNSVLIRRRSIALLHATFIIYLRRRLISWPPVRSFSLSRFAISHYSLFFLAPTLALCIQVLCTT